MKKKRQKLTLLGELDDYMCVTMSDAETIPRAR